jgi:hypothetical protein
MAFDPKPSTWLASWSEDETNITVPIATFAEMTAAEADATTGDIRKVLFAVCEALHAKWLATAVADRPARMTIGKRSSVNSTTGITTHYYSLDFETQTTAEEVAAE